MTPTPAIEITRDKVRTILKHALAHQPVSRIAALVGLPGGAVLEVLDANGYPVDERMREALDRLAPSASATTSTSPRPVPRPRPRPPAPPAPAGDSPVVGEPRKLLATADHSRSAKVRRAAAKVRKTHEAYETAVRALRAELKADEEDRAARARIRELEVELATLRKKVTSPKRENSTSTTPTPAERDAEDTPRKRYLPEGVTRAEVVTWAAEHYPDWSGRGRVPNRVVEAYTTATATPAPHPVEGLYEDAWPTPRSGEEA